MIPDLSDPNPKTFTATALIAAVAAWVPWTVLTSVLAETQWPDVGRDFVALLYMAVSSYFIYLARRDAAGAKAATEATGAKVEETSIELNTKADAAKDQATKAARLAHTAAQVAVVSDKKADRRDEVLAQVAAHTNGEYAALKAERDELRRWKEEQLAAQVPVPVAQKIDHIAEAVDEVLVTSKSGTKLGRPRSPDARERRDDPKE